MLYALLVVFCQSWLLKCFPRMFNSLCSLHRDSSKDNWQHTLRSACVCWSMQILCLCKMELCEKNLTFSLIYQWPFPCLGTHHHQNFVLFAKKKKKWTHQISVHIILHKKKEMERYREGEKHKCSATKCLNPPFPLKGDFLLRIIVAYRANIIPPGPQTWKLKSHIY